MNRFGRLILILLILGGGVFAGLVWLGDRLDRPVPDTPVASAPSANGLVIPVANVPAAALRDTFRDARSEGRSHDAIDIPAPTGTPVLAAAAGTIEKLFESAQGGHTIYVRTDGGRTIHYYAHLDGYAIDAREGFPVARGQQLGTVGYSGNANPAGPHLHFAVKRMAPGQRWHEGTAVDPYPLLAAAGAGR